MGHILLEIDEAKIKGTKPLENMVEELEGIDAVSATAVVELAGGACMEAEEALVLSSDIVEVRDRIFQMEGDDPLSPLRELRERLDELICEDAARVRIKSAAGEACDKCGTRLPA